MKFRSRSTYCIVFEENWTKLVLDKEKEREEDDKKRDDDEEDDSQATVNHSTKLHS